MNRSDQKIRLVSTMWVVSIILSALLFAACGGDTSDGPDEVVTESAGLVVNRTLTLNLVSVTYPPHGYPTMDVTGPSGLTRCSGSCALSYPDGSTLTLQPNALFLNWGGSQAGTCSGSTVPCTFTIVGDVTVRANFH